MPSGLPANSSIDTIAIIGPKGIPKDFPGTSGVEAYVENQIPRLVQQGNKIRCYVRRWATPKNIANYKGTNLIILPSINTTFFDTISYSLLASIHSSLSNSTIVWYHTLGPAFFSFIPKLFHKRVYTTIHSLDWNRKKWNGFAQLFLKLSERIALRSSDKVFVVSKQLKEYYNNQYHKEIFVDKYKVTEHLLTPPDIIRRKYNLKKNGYILYMGRFVPEKRIEWLIRASSEIINIQFILSGGSSHTDAYVRFLKRIATNRNIIFTGYVFGKEKAELLSNCKLFVLPSTLEGYPISVVDAIGYGKRCLVGDFLKYEYSPKNGLVHYFDYQSYDRFLLALKRLTKADE